MKVTCKADTNKGAVTGPGAALVRISFTGCTTTAVAGVLCQSPNGVPGEMVIHIPQGVTHSTSNVGQHPGRRIVLFSPAGMEHFFLETGQPTADDEPDLAAVGRLRDPPRLAIRHPGLTRSAPQPYSVRRSWARTGVLAQRLAQQCLLHGELG